MAERLHIDTSDDIIYRARKLRQRHDELVIQCEAGSLELQAENMDKKYPHVRSICEELQKKYAYADEDYLVIAPQNTFDIIKEGRMLHHCVGNDGAGERYYDRIERRESFIMFLRRAEEPEDPYYTLEIEPDGTVRQKRTLFDRQHEDIEQATEFLQKWQKVIAARLTGQDLKLAEQSRVLRNEEFIQMAGRPLRASGQLLQGGFMRKTSFEYHIHGYRYAPESFHIYKGQPGQEKTELPLSDEQRYQMGYLYLTQGIKSAVDYVKHIERERERKCRLYMTYGFMLKENPRSYVYCADLRCRENDPPAVRLQTLRAFREHLAQSEGRIEQSVECELDGRYRPIHMRKNYVTADFDRPIVAWLNIR